ncbi:MAG: hypothetical protein WD691_11405 [Acidimicrobiales bacterium]
MRRVAMWCALAAFLAGMPLISARPAAASSLVVTSERLTVASSSVTVPKSTVAVSQVAAGGVVNEARTSTATLTGGTATASGTVTFTLFPGGSCTGTPVSPGAQDVLVTGAAGHSYVSPARTPTSAGPYSWSASYSGDTNNLAASNCTPITVTPPAQATVVVSQVAAGGVVNAVRTSTATLSGGTAGATGTLTFQLFLGGTCSGTQMGTTESLAVSGAAGHSYVSAGRTPTSAGTYSWLASYGGDANNLGDTDCKVITITAAVVTVSQVAAGGAPNTARTTTATLTGGTVGATGTLTFQLFPGVNCTGTQVGSTDTVTVSGAVNHQYTSAARTPTTAGSYSWQVAYSGDSNNLGDTDCTVITVANSTVLHVSAITFVSSANQGNFWNATIQIEVRDGNDILVGTVTVTGSWAPTILASSRSNCGSVTTGSGTCTVASGTGSNGFGNAEPTQTWTVSTLSRSGYTYDSTANTVSSITVTKP